MTAGFLALGPEPRAPHVVRSEIQAALTGLLQETGRFAAMTDRLRLIDAVTRRSFGRLTVEANEHDQTHLAFIVWACAANDSLGELVAVLEPELGPHDRRRLLMLRDEWVASANFDDADWQFLHRELPALPLSNVQDLYWRTVGWGFRPPPPYCTDVWRLFVHLAGLNGGEVRVPPFMLFLWLVCDQFPGARVQDLRGLLDRFAQQWGITEPFQRARYRLDRARVTERHDPTLLIAIDFGAPERYTVTYWLQRSTDRWFVRGDDRTVPWAGLEAAVQEIVASAEARWPAGSGQLRIEFLLPLELLNLPVERWTKESDPDDGRIPLYLQHPVVVRSLDRARDRRRLRVWHNRWTSLCESPQAVDWLASRGPAHRLEEEIVSDERIVTMILSEPPPGRSEGAAREIRIAIRTGVPIVIWHRHTAPTGPFLDLIETLVVGGGMAELPDRARQLRINTSMAEDDGGVGQGLVLLWDDPSRLPGEFEAITGGR